MQTEEERTKQQIDQAIVAFIDILGYSELVGRLMKSLAGIRIIENAIQGSSVGLFNAMKSRISFPEPYHKYYHQLLRAIDVKFISDTILITLNLNKTEVEFPDFNKDERLFHCIHIYLRNVCMLSTIFIATTGLVIRGGISMGSHYETQHESSLFIFSQAYLNAYRLEKEARLPRILIDNELFQFLKGFPLSGMGDFFFDDEDKKCLNIYAHFDRIVEPRLFLQGIKTRVVQNIIQNRRNESALEKLLYFCQFHNRKVLLLDSGFHDLLIDTSKINNLSVHL